MMSVPALKAVLAVTSSTALAPMGHSHVLAASAKTLREFSREVGQLDPITVAMPVDFVVPASEILKEAGVDFVPLVVDPRDAHELATALKLALVDFTLVAIHDSNRPLTRLSQFHRTLEALLADAEAVRSSTPFTETLKSVSSDQLIEYTIDRTSVRRISTPEIVRVSAIDFAGRNKKANQGWFLPLKSKTAIGYVDSDPESIRVNSNDELALLASFLHWQQTVAQK